MLFCFHALILYIHYRLGSWLAKPAIYYFAKILSVFFLIIFVQSGLKLTTMLAGAIALAIALQGAVVLRQLVGAAIAGRRSTTATNMYLPC